MADGDFLYLQNQLALMVGADDIAMLPDSEQAQIRDCINQAYYQCYVPQDGLRPGWTQRAFAQLLPARVSLPVTVTKGSTTVTCAGYAAIDANFTFSGSFVRIGPNYYTRVAASYNGEQVTGFEVLEPLTVESGTYDATFFFNSFALNARAVSLLGRPELMGEGLLSPMSGKDNELLYRTLISGDFTAGVGEGYGRSVQYNSTGITFEEGRPLFYFIDQSMFDTAAGIRFVLYPLPVESRVVRFRAHVVPEAMENSTDRPELPPETVKSVLLPIAVYNYCSRTRRYNGDNRTFLRDEAARAEQRLRASARAQKRNPSRVTVRRGYA